MKEMVGATQIGSTQTGALGTAFSFTAPSTGSGQLQIDATYTANFQISTSTGVEGDLSFSIDGPQLSGSIFGVPFSFGPLGSFTFFDDSTGLGADRQPIDAGRCPNSQRGLHHQLRRARRRERRSGRHVLGRRLAH